MNTIGYFEIQADDPPRLADFYHQLFGWRFSKDENVPVPYWRIETGGIRGGLLQRPANTPPMECGTNAYVCSIEVEEIDALSEKVIAQGGQIALPKFPVPGVCWHAYFIDIDRNTFGVFQPDEAAK